MLKNVALTLVLFCALLFSVPFAHGKMSLEQNFESPAHFTLKITETDEVVTLSVTDYLIGCLFAQIPPDYHIEALKAQAVAAHTYALRFIKNNSIFPDFVDVIGGANLTDDARVFQPYYSPDKAREFYKDDYERYYDKIKTAAEFGAKHVILYADEPINAVYHNVSSGVTNTPGGVWGQDFPYLKSVNSEWDTLHPDYLCINEFALDRVLVAFLDHDRSMQIPESPDDWFTAPKVNAAGYVESADIGETTFSGGDIWRILNLRSPAFKVTLSSNVFSFETKGFGHGVGLSQFGANHMAENGKTALEILSYYYSDVEIRGG